MPATWVASTKDGPRLPCCFGEIILISLLLDAQRCFVIADRRLALLPLVFLLLVAWQGICVLSRESTSPTPEAAARVGCCLRGLSRTPSSSALAFCRAFFALARSRSRTVSPDLRDMEEKADVLWVDTFSVCCWLMDGWSDPLRFPSSAGITAPGAAAAAPSTSGEWEESSQDGLAGALF